MVIDNTEYAIVVEPMKFIGDYYPRVVHLYTSVVGFVTSLCGGGKLPVHNWEVVRVGPDHFVYGVIPNLIEILCSICWEICLDDQFNGGHRFLVQGLE